MIVHRRRSPIDPSRHSQATGRSRIVEPSPPRGTSVRRRRSPIDPSRHSQAIGRKRTVRLSPPRGIIVRRRRSPISQNRHSQAIGRSRIVEPSPPRGMSVRRRRSPIDPSQHSRRIDPSRAGISPLRGRRVPRRARNHARPLRKPNQRRRPSANGRRRKRPRRKRGNRNSRSLRASKASPGFLAPLLSSIYRCLAFRRRLCVRLRALSTICSLIHSRETAFTRTCGRPPLLHSASGWVKEELDAWSAPAWNMLRQGWSAAATLGRRGPRFKSAHPDQQLRPDSSEPCKRTLPTLLNLIVLRDRPPFTRITSG